MKAGKISVEDWESGRVDLGDEIFKTVFSQPHVPPYIYGRILKFIGIESRRELSADFDDILEEIEP